MEDAAMARQDTVDFLTAFAVGTVLGIGATLLLTPERTPKQRLVRQLKPYRKQMKKSYVRARDAVREGSHATGDLTSEAVSAGRELLGEFRHEVSGILDEARSELRQLVDDQAKDLTRGVKRTRRKLGM
jgi:gas vesicle protein